MLGTLTQLVPIAFQRLPVVQTQSRDIATCQKAGYTPQQALNTLTEI